MDTATLITTIGHWVINATIQVETPTLQLKVTRLILKARTSWEVAQTYSEARDFCTHR